MGLIFSIISCSEKQMLDVNKDVNHASNVQAANLLPTVIVESAFGTTGTDIAWCASVYVEHDAGTFGQLQTADRRSTITTSLFNNNWNSVYAILETLNILELKCSENGQEPNNYICLGIAKLLTAYNYAVATDMWGSIPRSEALTGTKIMQPKFDSQKDVYTFIFQEIDDAIGAFNNQGSVDPIVAKNDLMYGGDVSLWLKAAYGLKARYLNRLSNVIGQMPENVKNASIEDCVAKSFASNDEGLVFRQYTSDANGENPWYQFYRDRDYLGVSETFYNLLAERNDPRIPILIDTIAGGEYYVAPSGQANGGQGTYSVSALYSATAPTPLMSYHELLFIRAEVQARTGQTPAAKASLKKSVEAAFGYYDLKKDSADKYFDNNIAARFDSNPIKEIMLQKYIAGFEVESIEAYNDFRRYGGYSKGNSNNNYLVLENPNNESKGFVNSFPYSSDEIYANKNVPARDPLADKVWWAGGAE